MKTPLFLLLISQFLLMSSVSAYSVNTAYSVKTSYSPSNGTYSYGYSYPYVNTYYGSSNTVSNEPRTVTIECTENSSNYHDGPGMYTVVYYMPTCSSLTGEGSPNSYYSPDSQSQPTFSGFSNYRCVRYYQYNNPNSQCIVYRYDTTYTPPAVTTPVNQAPNYNNPISVTPAISTVASKICYLGDSYCMYGGSTYQGTQSYSWPTYGSSQYTYTH